MEQGEQGTRRRVLEWFTRWDRTRIAVGGGDGKWEGQHAHPVDALLPFTASNHSCFNSGGYERYSGLGQYKTFTPTKEKAILIL
jgi:predicted AlkP superfamily pyrophosphatase or phosphodiesterase